MAQRVMGKVLFFFFYSNPTISKVLNQQIEERDKSTVIQSCFREEADTTYQTEKGYLNKTVLES